MRPTSDSVTLLTRLSHSHHSLLWAFAKILSLSLCLSLALPLSPSLLLSLCSVTELVRCSYMHKTVISLLLLMNNIVDESPYK